MTKYENFKNFLIHYDAYDAFCKNIYNQNGQSWEDVVGPNKSLHNIIDNSIIWNHTPENTTFWGNLSSKWNTALSIGKTYTGMYKSIW